MKLGDFYPFRYLAGGVLLLALAAWGCYSVESCHDRRVVGNLEKHLSTITAEVHAATGYGDSVLKVVGPTPETRKQDSARVILRKRSPAVHAQMAKIEDALEPDISASLRRDVAYLDSLQESTDRQVFRLQEDTALLADALRQSMAASTHCLQADSEATQTAIQAVEQLHTARVHQWWFAGLGAAVAAVAVLLVVK